MKKEEILALFNSYEDAVYKNTDNLFIDTNRMVYMDKNVIREISEQKKMLKNKKK